MKNSIKILTICVFVSTLTFLVFLWFKTPEIVFDHVMFQKHGQQRLEKIQSEIYRIENTDFEDAIDYIILQTKDLEELYKAEVQTLQGINQADYFFSHGGDVIYSSLKDLTKITILTAILLYAVGIIALVLSNRKTQKFLGEYSEFIAEEDKARNQVFWETVSEMEPEILKRHREKIFQKWLDLIQTR